MRGNEYDIRKAREKREREDTSHSEKEAAANEQPARVGQGGGDLLRDLAPLRVVNELYNLMSHYSGFRRRLRGIHICDRELDANPIL